MNSNAPTEKQAEKVNAICHMTVFGAFLENLAESGSDLPEGRFDKTKAALGELAFAFYAEVMECQEEYEVNFNA